MIKKIKLICLLNINLRLIIYNFCINKIDIYIAKIKINFEIKHIKF